MVARDLLVASVSWRILFSPPRLAVIAHQIVFLIFIEAPCCCCCWDARAHKMSFGFWGFGRHSKGPANGGMSEGNGSIMKSQKRNSSGSVLYILVYLFIKRDICVFAQRCVRLGLPVYIRTTIYVFTQKQTHITLAAGSGVLGWGWVDELDFGPRVF